MLIERLPFVDKLERQLNSLERHGKYVFQKSGSVLTGLLYCRNTVQVSQILSYEPIIQAKHSSIFTRKKTERQMGIYFFQKLMIS